MRRAPTRRAVLGALSVTPLAGLITAVPITAARSAAGAEWHALKARYDAAEQAEDAFWEQVYLPAQRAYDAEWEAVPHTITSASYEAMSGARLHMRTDERTHVQIARKWHGSDADADTLTDEITAVVRELLASVDHREEQRQAIWARHRLDEIDDSYEALAAARSRLEEQLLATPAPDGAAAAWKLEQLVGEPDDSESAVFTDLRRFLLGEG